MEDKDEALRLDLKTDVESIKERAFWCGIGPGARVLDVGCGSGKTSSILHELVQPGGEIVGIDYSEERINYAIKNFGQKSIVFKVVDIFGPVEELGQFDFVWVQFFLEFFQAEAPEIVKKLSLCLKPDGYLCLLDLDNNCLNNYQLTEPMESVINNIIKKLESDFNFDPYAGRKLYSYLYDINCRDIQVHIYGHHLNYGKIKFEDYFNWIKKIELTSRLATDIFKEYPGGYDSFLADYNKFINDNRHFIYSPLIICKGKKPVCK